MFIKSVIFCLMCYIFTISAKYLFPEDGLIFSHPQNLENSHFGYSVQLQLSKNGNSRLVVGAPRSSDQFHGKLNQPGVIFSCSLSENFEARKCDQFDFDSRNDNILIQGKNHSCLGYSLDVKSDGRLVACAPRWVNYYITKNTPLRMNGMCYYLNDASDTKPAEVQNLIALNDTALEFDGLSYNYIFGEMGFSSHLLNDKNSLILTAVGLRNWTGGAVQYNQMENGDTSNNFIVTPKNVRKLETYSYFGYSLTSGHFNSSDLSRILYVSGAPRSDNLTGMVYMYEQLRDFQTFTKHYDFPGQQFGEYFGASLAVADLNGDDLDDLIIGAPLHSSDTKEEVGRIYPYITKKYDRIIRFKRVSTVFMGEKGRDRFGTAISSLGDINKDGFDDIAVGAPYHDDAGAVYIYLGQNGNNALRLDQKISASKFFPYLRGFGYSLSQGVDIDNNYNNDLAVGSYLSGNAVIIKSRPIVKIIPYLAANVKQIDMNTNKFTLTKCLKYSSKDIPSELQIKITLTTDRSLKIFNGKNVYTSEEIYRNNEDKCSVINAVIKENIPSDVKILLNYNIVHTKLGPGFCKECPIDETLEKTKKLIIPFASGCRSTVCQPDLKLQANFNFPKESFIIGSSNEIDVIVTIENRGENSFGTKLLMETNPSIIKIENYENHCIPSKNHVSCNLGTLEADLKRIISFTLNVEDLSISDKEVMVSLAALSNSDVDNNNNNITLTLPLSTDIKYNFISESRPENLVIPENITKAAFVHNFKIESIGQTNLELINLNIFVPFEYNEKIIADNIKTFGCTNQVSEEIITVRSEISSNEITENTINLNCLSTELENLRCKKIKCEIKDESKTKLGRNEIKILFDIDISIFLDETNSIFLISSLQTDSNYINESSYARSTLIPSPKSASITLYIIIGLVIGIFLILIVAFILYKCGCFKKKIPPVLPEEEPLNEGNDPENVSSKPQERNAIGELDENHKEDSVSVENNYYTG